MTMRRVIALLGKRDAPTDAVEEYCRYLGRALAQHEISLELRRVPWDSRGWSESLKDLRLQAQSLPPYTWFLVQYTALAWSTRGFPFQFLRVLKVLRASNACIAVVFHDVEPFPGSRLVDRFRHALQTHVMRRAVAVANRAVFTVPLEKISWLPAGASNAVFVPVGPNLPVPSNPYAVPPAASRLNVSTPVVAVFGITGGSAGVHETQLILASIRAAAQELGKLHLCVFGRNADSAGPTLREGIRDLPVDLSVEGVLEEAQVVERLSTSDVLLFVRGAISSRRGSAIAGIACGLPVIAFAGSETAAPITDAGVVLVPSDNQDELNATLLRVLSDPTYRTELSTRSRRAFAEHFSWRSIAIRLAALLK